MLILSIVCSIMLRISEDISLNVKNGKLYIDIVDDSSDDSYSSHYYYNSDDSYSCLLELDDNIDEPSSLQMGPSMTSVTIEANIKQKNDQPVIENGSKCWYQHGELHRDNDEPAMIESDGTKYWYQHGKRHRDNDKPAVIYDNGSKYWYQHGKLHRDDDQPAVIDTDNFQIWYKHGELHRDNGYPAISYFNSTEKRHSYEYYENGKKMGEIIGV